MVWFGEIEKKLATLSMPVSPAYGFSALALVKCSNEGGPGPRHNMKEDPGTFTLIMKREHGCHMYLMPWFSESGDNRNRRMGLPPHQSNQDRTPSHPLSGTHPSPKPEYQWRPASEKTHFGLGYKVRGHGLGKRRMWRPL